MHGFNLTPSDALETVRCSLMTDEAIVAFSKLEFELTAWRLHRITLQEKLNQLDNGIQHNGDLYVRFEDVSKILGLL